MIAEFELLLPEIEAKEIMLSEEQLLTFEHVLLFCTGMDRIPPYCLTQKIEVVFKDVSLPCANTCGLHLTLATVDIKGKWAIAVNFVVVLEKFNFGFRFRIILLTFELDKLKHCVFMIILT